MRLLLFVLLVSCTKHEPVEAPGGAIANSELRRRPHMAQEAAGCRRNNQAAGVSIEAPVSPDAPIVVLDETHLHGQSPVSPRIAIWADGEVVFAREDHGDEYLVTTRIPRERAAAIARDVSKLLDDVPLFTEVFATSGGTVMRITVQVDGRWRSAAVHGDDAEDFLAVARGTAAPPRPPKERQMLDDFDFAELKAERPWPPMGFAKAYQRLVEIKLFGGARFAPYDYDVVFITPERGAEARQPALEWPATLPRLPADLKLPGCHYDDHGEMDYEGGCSYVLEAANADAARRFRAKMWASGAPVGVIANGETFLVRFDWKYRGERTVEAIAACASVLSHSPDAP